jgi:hypothetical protein
VAYVKALQETGIQPPGAATETDTETEAEPKTESETKDDEATPRP